MHSQENGAVLLQEQNCDATPNMDLITNCPDPRMREVEQLIQRAFKADTCLVLGESGSGKEHVAQAIHEVGRRSQQPLIIANCGAIPEHLVESQFFGHERGAFTGAHARHVGFFERAKGGTIFLDEIGELPLQLQPRFLRVLQGQPFFRTGGTEEIVPNCKVIAATNQNLEKRVSEREFREDLYYRLVQYPITVPPLRARPLDIMHLSRLFTTKYSFSKTEISHECEPLLVSQEWWGNVRELENMIRRAVYLMEGDSKTIDPSYLQKFLKSGPRVTNEEITVERHTPELFRLIQREGGWNNLEDKLFKSIYQAQSRNYQGKMYDTELADLLGLHRATLITHRKEWGL
jgi:transcriptional regulator with GAF, ATPase, and Fis domain